MKRNLLLLAFLCFTPLHAFGDFVPGRVRESAKAALGAEGGTGRYEQVRGALALQFVTDGKGVTRFALSLDARPELPFRVQSVRPGRCGSTYVTRFDARTTLTIDEVNPEACGGRGAVEWRSTLRTEEGARGVSSLTLRGVPEFHLLTQ